MSLSDLAAGVVLAAAAITGAGLLLRWARRGFKTVDDAELLLSMTQDIKRVVDRELKNNHGTSLKDDVHGIAISVHRAHNRIDGLEDALRTFADANRLVLPLISDAINATPPQPNEEESHR